MRGVYKTKDYEICYLRTAKTKHPIFLIQPFPGSEVAYKPLIDELLKVNSKSDFVNFTLPGLGGRNRLIDKNIHLRVEDYAKMIGDFIDSFKPESYSLIACSMGGFFIPQVAKKYPNAKLIFAATGPRLQPKSLILKWAIANSDGILIKVLLTLGRYTPDIILTFFHKLINPIGGGGEERDYYQKDMIGNIIWTKKIPPDKQIEVLKYVKSVDNTELLQTMSNKSLIFAGSRDILMPPILSEELHRLLKNSQLNISDRGHFNVIWADTFKSLEKFLI